MLEQAPALLFEVLVCRVDCGEFALEVLKLVLSLLVCVSEDTLVCVVDARVQIVRFTACYDERDIALIEVAIEQFSILLLLLLQGKV